MAQEKDILDALDLNEILREGLTLMEARLRGMGISLTGSLAESLRGQVQTESARAYAELLIEMNEYGRFKDMRALRMPTGTPAPDGEYMEAIRAYVQKVGIDKFAYVPGYENSKKAPTADIALRRISWGLAIGRWKKQSISRSGKGFYNISVGSIMAKVKRNFGLKVSELVLRTVKDGLGDVT